MRAVRRKGMAQTRCEQHALGRSEHLDLDGAFDAIRRVRDNSVIVPRDRLAGLERAFLHPDIRALGDPVDLAGTHVRLCHGFSTMFATCVLFRLSEPQLLSQYGSGPNLSNIKSINARTFAETKRLAR